jgi:hypothetical protein
MILTSRRQQRMLAAIHHSLRTSDPRLVAKFIIFTRLTKDEAIPAVERVRLTPLGWLRFAVRGVTHRWHHRWRRWRGHRNTGGPWPAREARSGGVGRRLGGLLFFPAAIAALLAVALLTNQGQAQGNCAPARSTSSHTATQSSGAGHQAGPIRGDLVPQTCPPGQLLVTARGR